MSRPIDAWVRYLALLQVHPTIHDLYREACRARGTARHERARERYLAAVMATPVLRDARQAWLDAVQAAWSREAA